MITVSADPGDALMYPVVTLDPWTLETFECTVEEEEPTEGSTNEFYAVDYHAAVTAEVDMAELVLLVYIDDYLFREHHPVENLTEGQTVNYWVGGGMSKSAYDIDVNNYDCRAIATWTY